MAQIMDALDPVKRAERKLATAKLPLELQQIDVQKKWMADHPGQMFMNPMQALDYRLKQSRINANESLINQRNTPKQPKEGIPAPPHPHVPPTNPPRQGDVNQAAQAMQQEQQLPPPDLPADSSATDPNAPQIIPTS
jgi:hypothetical protein